MQSKIKLNTLIAQLNELSPKYDITYLHIIGDQFEIMFQHPDKKLFVNEFEEDE